MTRYELLLFLHVAAAIVWLGSGFFLQALVFRAERTRDRALTKSLGDSAEWMARRIFIPASLSVLVLGVLLVLDSPLQFDDLWILVGLGGFLFSFLVGIGLVEPEGKRIGKTIERVGPDHPEVARRIRKINVISRVELVILYLVVADMVLKPTEDDVGSLVVGALIAASAVAAGIWLLRSAGPVTDPARAAD
jgi:uncharacterized membrane protein